MIVGDIWPGFAAETKRKPGRPRKPRAPEPEPVNTRALEAQRELEALNQCMSAMAELSPESVMRVFSYVAQWHDINLQGSWARTDPLTQLPEHEHDEARDQTEADAA